MEIAVIIGVIALLIMWGIISGLTQENKEYEKRLSELESVLKTRYEEEGKQEKARMELQYRNRIYGFIERTNISAKLEKKHWLTEETKDRIEQNRAELQLACLLELYPGLEDVIETKHIQLAQKSLDELPLPRVTRGELMRQNTIYKKRLDEALTKICNLEQQVTNDKTLAEINLNKINNLKQQLNISVSFLKGAESNLSAIPYMAKLIADYETYQTEQLAQTLDWGYDKKRLEKVATIREIREEAKTLIEQSKEAEYQLAYLLELYPVLEDVIETDYRQLPKGNLEELPDHDPSRSYLSREEYNALSETERNQLALDRYIGSHNKTKWQIGRDYELFNGYQYEQQGCNVEYFGSNEGLEDLGRDLIVHQKDGPILIVQCKYWANKKLIHEKHIMQLYGTTICYAIEHNLFKEAVKCLFITNIELSPMAKKMANSLGVEYKENVQLGDFPRIKCNNGKDENGNSTKIYHLPFDQQYDKVQLKHKDDCWAYTVKDAESLGYRRAKKWFGA